MREEARLLGHPDAWIAFGLGTGLSPVAPGTCGTVLAVPFYLAMARLDWILYGALVVLLFALGTWVAGRVVRHLGRQDPQVVVIDEMVGYWIAMLPVAGTTHWAWLLAGFGLFRLFDIAKPWPIGALDRRIGGGLGVMLDDAVAGFYAAAILALAAWWLGGAWG